MSLDERLDQIVELLKAGRAVNWSLGDEIVRLQKDYGDGVIGQIAEMAQCTKERIRQLSRVSGAFPEEERYPDTEWTIYRATLQAAVRTKKSPREMLDYVVKRGLSVRDISKIGVDRRKKVGLSKVCEWCGAKITITAAGDRLKEPVHCPFCIAKLIPSCEIQQYILGYME